MKRLGLVLMLAATLLPVGCKSAYVEATVRNETGGPVRLVEVDYPSASFGKESLPAGAEFKYRFKVLGSGATKVMWTDAAKVEHTVPGPSLKEGNEGQLTVQLQPTTAAWSSELKGR